jgi:hypothetical protein
VGQATGVYGRMSWAADFPRLTPHNHRVTSPATEIYNCVAWAAEDVEHWWQPGEYWLPANWPKDDFGLKALEQAFRALGYESCDIYTSLESGFAKVALYGSGFIYTHAARQLPKGKWTSKLGRGEDIEHDSPDDVAGGVYGVVMSIMKRRVSA